MTDTTSAPKCALQYILYNPKQYANLSFSLTITFAFSLFAVLMIFADLLATRSASFVLCIDPSLGASFGLGSTCGLWLRACPALPIRLAALCSCNPCADTVSQSVPYAFFRCAPASWTFVHHWSREDGFLCLMADGFERSFETGSCRIARGQKLLPFSSILLSFLQLFQQFCNTACQLHLDLLRENFFRLKAESWGAAAIPKVVQVAATSRVNEGVEFYEWLIYWQLGSSSFWRTSSPLSPIFRTD